MSLKAGFLALTMAAAAMAAMGAGSAAAKENSVFDLFDRGVMSIVASHACKSADAASLRKFTRDFGRVATLVEDELQSMNPDQRRDDLGMLIGFRVAQLELRAENAVKTNGCDAAEVKTMRELFDLRAHLAKIEVSANTVTH